MSATATERADLERRLAQAEARAVELTAAQVRGGGGRRGGWPRLSHRTDLGHTSHTPFILAVRRM